MCHRNALFLCERIALHPDDLTWVHLLSLSCFRLGRYSLAAEDSREREIHGRHLVCPYIFAQACFTRSNMRMVSWN